MKVSRQFAMAATALAISAVNIPAQVSTSDSPQLAWRYGTMGCANPDDLDYLPAGDTNFIESTSYAAKGGGDPVTTLTLHDSFGDPWPTRNIGFGWNGDDIVTLVENDAIGRLVRQWLPTPVSPEAPADAVFISASARSYHEDSHPFASSGYRDDLRSRKVLSTAAGAAMQSHAASSFRSSNSSSRRCRRFEIDRNGQITCRGMWSAGQLAVDVTTDADGRQIQVFTDFRGNKVLERRKLNLSAYADTYFVNDNLGRLRAVLPPELSSRITGSFDPSTSADFADYGYLYTYDNRMRLTSRKLPGAERIDYGYDRTGALTLWSDGEQRARGVVGFALRDAAGRPNVSGEAAAVPLTSAENIMATATCKPTDSRADASGHTYNIALSDMKIHKAVYYDNYRFMRDVAAFARLDSLSPWFYANGRKSMALGSLTAVFGKAGNGITVPGFRASVTEFDIEGRPTQIHTTGLNNTVSTRINEYAFDGLPTYSYDYLRDGSVIDGVLHYYGYDSRRRLTADTVKVRHIAPGVYTDSVAAIVRRTYDRLGRPSLVRPHTEATYGYNYNLRGQITEITSRYLIQKLHYETGGRTPQYGGNVSAMEWRNYGMGSDVGMWRYDYSYDNLDRLTAADFTATATDGPAMATDYSCGYTYDLNSNLTSLWRRGPTILSPVPVYDEIDRLSIDYSGNRITDIFEDAEEVVLENSMDFKYPGLHSGRTYDLNGNLTADPARGIESIENNPLGLPQTIGRGKGCYDVNMIYDADGNRLAYWRDGSLLQIFPGLGGVSGGLIGGGSLPGSGGPIGGGLPTTPITQENLKPETRLFFGPLTYVGGSLARIDTDGGYIADGRFHAVYPDFQGNIRAVACGGEIKQVNHYYPYGLPFAEGIKPDAQPYKYGAKELITDANLNLYDFHARWQDPVVPGFSRLDQMLEKYYNISPYAYCAGNPIRFIDPTGMDYVVNRDDENKTVTIGATYITSPEAYDSAVAAVSLWNDLSNQFETQSGYSIIFDMEVINVNDLPDESSSDFGDTNLNVKGSTAYIKMSDFGTNAYIIEDIGKNENGEIRTGATQQDLIQISPFYETRDTGAHEIGHSLSLRHSVTGLMTPSSSDLFHSRNVSKNQIRNIIRAANNDRNKEDKDGGSGQLLINGNETSQSWNPGKLVKKKH